MLTHFFGGIGKRLNVRWKVETLPIHEPNLNQKRADQPHSEHGAFNALKMGSFNVAVDKRDGDGRRE